METNGEYRWLEPHIGSSYKQLFIKGTKLRALVVSSDATPDPDDPDPQRTPEEVAADYGIPVEAVYEALRYCASKPRELAYDLRKRDLMDQFNGIGHPDYKNNPQKYRRSPTPEERTWVDRKLREEFPGL